MITGQAFKGLLLARFRQLTAPETDDRQMGWERAWTLL